MVSFEVILDGENFGKGIKNKLSIARVVLPKPSIPLLDEVNGGIDFVACEVLYKNELINNHYAFFVHLNIIEL